MVMGYADGGRKGSGGTGSIIQSDGLVLTNAHVAIEEQTGRSVDLSSTVDENILGGIVLQVGNMVLDASIRNRLEKLRKAVASAA